MGPRDSDGAEDRFSRLYDAHYRDILAYALRRAVGPDRAADAVAETFLTAWRRLDEVPPDGEARLWLFGVARRVLANQRRGAQRRDALVERLAAEISTIQITHPDEAAVAGSGQLTEVGRALRTLSERDREVLTLVGWEGLGNQEVAAVLGCTHTAARIRVHRARRRLADALGAAAPGVSSPASPPSPASPSSPASPPRLTEGLHR